MKKLLKLSATALILAGANMLFSQSALACTQNDPNYHSCMYHNILNQPQTNSHSSYGSGVISDYLGLAWTKDAEPFFYKAQYRTNYGFTEDHFEQSDADTLYECNKSNRRSPCKGSISVVNGCIAIAKGGEGKYASTGATCSEAKQGAMQTCQAEESNPNACKIYKTKKS